MQSLLGLLAAGALVVAGGSAQAVTANFTVTVELELSGVDPILFSAEGTGETIPGGSVTLPQGSIVAGYVSRLVEPVLGLLPGIAVCGQDQETSFFPIPATPGFEVFDCDPLENGELDELVYDGVSEGVGGVLATAYLTNDPGFPQVAIPLEIIGVGGTLQFTVLGTPATLIASPWTTGTVSVTGGLAGEPPTTLTGTGSDGRDAAGLGELKLVTEALVNLGTFGTVPAIGRLNITFPAPEPGAGAVGVAAVGALALLARRRARRS